MSEGPDVLVLGGGLAGATVAAALALAGARTRVVAPSGGPSFAGGILRGSTAASLPDWLADLPHERWLVEHRALFLETAASVSIDFHDGPSPSVRGGDRTISAGRAADHLLDRARSAGAVVSTELPPEVARPAGAAPGTDGGMFGAKLTIVADPSLAPASQGATIPAARDGPGWSTLRRTYPVEERAIDRRFGVGPENGVVIDCVLGFLPPGVAGGGHLYTNRSSITLSVSIRGPYGPERPERARAAIETLARHPAIAPLLGGATAAEESSESRAIAVDASARPYGPGYLLVGPAAGRAGHPLIGLPSVGREIASGVAAAETAIEALRRSDASATFLGRYPRRLRELLQADPAEGVWTIRELSLNPRLQGPYPSLLVSALHEMMTETGRRKESIHGTLRRVRRASGVSWSTLARDAASAARSP